MQVIADGKKLHIRDDNADHGLILRPARSHPPPPLPPSHTPKAPQGQPEAPAAAEEGSQEERRASCRASQVLSVQPLPRERGQL